MSDTTEIQKLQLEIGGSYFELIEFSLLRRVKGRELRGRYGVNVAKVRPWQDFCIVTISNRSAPCFSCP